MPSAFETKKRKILEALAIPDDQYQDLSPKGSVDAGIRALVDEINQTAEYVTTSSCAGRVSVFLAGESAVSATVNGEHDREERASPGGKGGGGRWLYVSHDPVDLSSYSEPGALLSLFGLEDEGAASLPDIEPHTRYVHLKFEPWILHILTSSLPAAQHALSAAMSAGFRESGISNITGPEPTPMVAVRSSGLAFDSIIGVLDPTTNIVKPLVTESYLRLLVQVANQRFAINEDRKERFRLALLHAKKPTERNKSEDPTWEPSDVRRERKRAEGLRRRAELVERQGDHRGNDAEDGQDEEQLGTGLLLESF